MRISQKGAGEALTGVHEDPQGRINTERDLDQNLESPADQRSILRICHDLEADLTHLRREMTRRKGQDLEVGQLRLKETKQAKEMKVAMFQQGGLLRGGRGQARPRILEYQ